MAKILLGSFILGSAGITIEVLLTAVSDYLKKQDTALKGNSYVWMLPVYGSAYPILVWLWPKINGWNLVFRGLLYVVLIFIVEYIAGWLLRQLLGKCPWEKEYKDKKWSVSNLIRLDYAPGWFVVAIIFERLYLYLNKL